ncbi:MAG: hypothetical protein JO036_02475 [Candidatus Eremiobacteraeota bacterium]|nr:hypothetical protein [Candidatus Eremiobacteraeota bacterium]
MNPASDREAAADLARRIKASHIDPSKADEAHRPPSDQPPAYADLLMSEGTPSVERAADLNEADWELIGRALDHYGACRNADRAG